MFKKYLTYIGVGFLAIGIFFCIDSYANISLAADPANNFHVNILNEVSDSFKNQATAWGTKLEKYALTLFWMLASLSLTWTAIELTLKHAEFGEIIGELSKYIIFTGFFSFLLTQGPTIANAIFETFAKLGGIGAGLATGSSGLPTMKPSEIVDVGLDFYTTIWSSLAWDWDTIAMDLVSTGIGVVFFLFCLIIALKVLVQLISLWCYMYAGAFLLGFGGGRWTRNIAIEYFRGVLGASVKYFAMLFIVAIMNSLMTTLLKTWDITEPVSTLQALALPIMFFMIIETVPEMIAGIAGAKFTSGPAASAVAGAMVGGVAGAATSTVMAAHGAAAAAKGTSKAIDYMSNLTVSEGMKDLMNNTSAGKAIMGAGKNAKQIGKAVGNVTRNAAKASGKMASATSKGMSAAAGFTAQTITEPIESGVAVLSKGVSAGVSVGKSAMKAGYNAMKNAGSKAVDLGGKALDKTKDTVSENIVKPFEAGVDAAKLNPNPKKQPKKPGNQP